MTEIDALIAGFCGGCISTIFIIANYYWYLKTKTIQYVQANDELKNNFNLKNALEDIKMLRTQINEIYEELPK